MTSISFAMNNLRVIIYVIICIGSFQRVFTAQHAEDYDDAAHMSMSDFEHVKICVDPPPPENGDMECFKHKTKQNRYVCKAKCEPGFEFTSGKPVERLTCSLKTGKWSKNSFPECLHICDPPCENGGKCSEANHCICTPEYRGDRCQYEIALCDPNKGLHVSGDWICNSTQSDSRCVLNCPQGSRYESQPAELYVCSLDGTWSPSFAPKCIPINVIEPPASQSFYSISSGEAVQSTRPSSSVCSTWSASHYRTFDGGVYSFTSPCSYLFAKDCEQNTFAIHIHNGEYCATESHCPTAITIYIGAEMYVLTSGADGPYILNGEEMHPVPTSVKGLLFQMLSNYVTVTSPLGFKLKWNLQNTILLEVSSPLKNRTCGLCGKFDGSVQNDFGTSDGSITDSVEGFVNSWAMEHIGEKCDGKAIVKDSCAENKNRAQEAEQNCQIIYSDKFSSCHHLVNPKPYFETCRMDYCGCEMWGSCHCSSLTEYFRECVRLGGEIPGGWRSDELCPLSCPGGMVYSDCGTSCPITCKGTVYACEDDRCIDGCHCPEGTALHDGRCVEIASCPCLHNEKEYQSGERIIQDCNACECTAGKWQCTEETCQARCSSTGDPHYTTFDGYSYEFLGSCPYYLVYNEDFKVIQENGPCSSESNVEPATDTMFCTHSVTVEYKGNSLVLEPGIKSTFNSKPVELPLTELGFFAQMATDIFLQVKLENGLSILWDGENRIYIEASPALYDQTMGLCGTFNHNQKDDFMTPENDLEADVTIFASRWQASDKCTKRSRRSSYRSQCQMQPQKLSDANQLCYILKSHIFQACHSELEPHEVYLNCINDLCVCGENLEDCLCPILADYSLSCARKGIILDWINDIGACRPKQCTGGQVYKECGNPCACTCEVIASNEYCEPQCVQGCTCPDGMALNSEGFCVAVDQCPCFYKGKEYPASDVIVQGDQVCTCVNAKWECKMDLEKLTQAPATGASERLIETESTTCSDENNQEYTNCQEACPLACQNFHLPPKCTTEECVPGCKCKEGLILDTDIQKCVDIKQCGCIHANQRYKEGDTIKQFCNLCTCQTGEWQCTESVCPGICTAWGESHFKSYDGKIFDFHGDCEYVLSKGRMKGSSFSINVQNVPCGTSGVTCSKAFTLELGNLKQTRGDTNEIIAAKEKLTLVKDNPLPKMSLTSRFVVLESGLFVLVYTDVGVTIRWDKGTRIYVTLDPKWRTRVTGICGNFNDDQADDFLTPSGGLPEARASIFADSWKVQEFCPATQVIEDTCEIHPPRKSWAQQKCGILKSDVFAPCRTAVAMEPFYDRCVFDACGCDMGGDCDCLCTAIAAYAQECSIHGVSIKWRSQELCPIQCEECSTYDSCIPSCPKRTCENEYRYGKIEDSCSADFCVEGCNPKPCPAGQIYNNEVEYKCIPEVDCVVPCLEINGIIYNEGDRVTDKDVVDSCQSCHCQNGKIKCAGTPCLTIQPQRPCLKTGWTPWMNTPSFVGGDYEDLTNSALRTTYEEFCGVTNMTGIECRVAETKTPWQETGQNLICELPTGLMCNDIEQNHQICEDFEIRVFCDCGPMIETTTVPETTTQLITQAPECHHTGWSPWMSSVLPNEEGELETIERLRGNHIFCADHEIEDIECRSTSSHTYISKDNNEIICNKKVGLVCLSRNCDDYEVRVLCNCGPEATTPEVPKCVTGWTEFFNIDNPDYNPAGDDDESLVRIRERYQFCEGGVLKKAECKTLVDGQSVDFSAVNTFGMKCSPKQGFICFKDNALECPDFMVRFYCLCEPTEPTTLRIIETTPTPIPIVPVPFECGWTPWLNTDTPDVGEQDDGDLEDLSTIQYLYKTCGGADLKDIECRMSRTHHSSDLSQQNNLQCNLQDGFSCHNKDQIGKCYDYEIRLLCMYDWCYPATTTPVPTTTVTTVNPCPDGEVYDECAYRCDQMCSSFTHQMTSRCVSFTNCVPACRPIAGCEPPNVWRDYYTCVPKEECTCIFLEGDQERIVAPNEVFIKDCERCQCVHDQLNCVIDPTLCGPPPTGKTRLLIPKENITREDCWTEWVSIDSPVNGVGDLEKINTYWEKFEFCPDPVKIECRTISNKQKASEVGQYITCDLQTGLICWNKDNQPEGCYDYEVRYFCPCAATTLAPTTLPTTTVTTPPTLQPGICVFGWTEWFNSHHPDNRGDYESIQSSRFNHIFCSSDMITSIECRRAGTDGIGLLQRGVYCDLQAGLICSQDYLGEQESCWDYEVRFFCDCPTTEPFTEPETLPPIVTELPSLVPCAYWSDWINEHHPPEKGKGTKTGVKGKGAKVGGDTEKAMPLKLRREYDFCNDGIVTDIECRDAETDLDHKETGDKKTVCDMTSGFRCRGYDQPGKFCRDYKIRYYCSCKPTPAVIITKPSTPTIHIEPCTVYYNVIDGPKPLPDSHIKASTSKDSMSGPQSSRLSSISSTRSAGAWIAGDIDDRQFIEVDLGFIQNVYGVVTLGRHGHPEWVKSYKVLYSNDGLTFRYVGEDGIKEKIFGGNFDSITPIEHIFKKPFEARFVRIQPIDFHKEIALRFDIYGCAEGMTTVPTTITLPPTCTDEMGLYNGSIVDKQVKVSSSKLENTDERYIRLYTPGAWVAGELDENQFVEVDFEDLRELSGVQIQGRHNVSQWVTAFTVSYSQDGTIWNYITDSSGAGKKVFSGNYDSDTVVTVYFPQPIRARFVHINPVGWRNWISMRLEILGCYEAKEAVLSENTTLVPLEMLEGNCSQQMGFENRQLPDSAIWVSSSESPRSDASRIRLNTHADEEGTGGWIAATYDYKPVILIDFFGPRNLTGIETQGVEDVDKWVKTFYVKYSLDNITWEDAYAKETGYFGFDGNVDRDRPKLSVFSTMILARYLKVILVDYHGGPGLRMEVQGCFLPYEEILPPPATLTPTEFCAEWGDWLSLSDPASNPYGDEENINDIIAHTGKCYNPYEIQCRDMVTQQDYSKVRQAVSCDLQNGLLCLNNDQSSGLCHNYEVRIKCWTCGVETTTPSLPLILCPEVPESMKDNCPTSCAPDYACDGGFNCVPHADCACFVDGKKFKPSNLILTKDCQECDCLLGGHTSCRPKVCQPCSETQKAELDENCECRCVGCEEGTVICPTTQECIPESRWCDGVRDCQDDEIDCPTTPRITTVTTPPTTTTEVPIICSTDFVDVTDTCEMISNNFETFDGLSYQYDICDHVLMQEKTSNLYSVSVHKTCSPENVNACERYLHIEVDGVTLKIGPGMDDVTVQDNRVSVANLWIVSKRFQNFDIKKKGSSIVFKSKKYHFDVIWDNVQNAKIVISKCLMDQVVGLCGLYNKQVEDDRTTPDGSLVKSNQDFGNSWSIGPADRCSPPACEEYYMREAITTCEYLLGEPFNSACSSFLNMQTRVDTCITFMCECLQRTSLDARKNSDVFYDIYGGTDSCKCLALESFAEACEAVRQEPLLNWRIDYSCTPECPPGMEWQDCGPGCELTCDNYKDRDSLCTGGCTPGCYCPSGLIRHHDRCVKAYMCQDCICRGHGDPNFITFDGKYYAFQGNCTYVLAQSRDLEDPSLDFKILVTNVECPEEPHTSCADGLQIYWNGHVIEKFKNKPVYLNRDAIDSAMSPLEKDGISITYIPNKHTIIHIKSINLAVRYFDQMYGFNVELPAFYYYNKTEGLCGICNFIQSDDIYHKNGYITDDIDDFAYSWLVEPNTKDHCEFPRIVVPEPRPGICNFTVSPCEIFLDPSLYSKSCQNDVTYSLKPEASMCRSKFQYAQQCCERGISLIDWLQMSGCENSCPEGMFYDCTSACQKTCDNYKTFKEEDCDLMPLYTCRCPEGQVLQQGQCVDVIQCEKCDEEHIVGDVWHIGPCEQCECLNDRSTKCTVTTCPEVPICKENEKLDVLPKPEGACCEVYHCVEVALIVCPETKPLECGEGESNVVYHEEGCPRYKCVCDPVLCPPLVKPFTEEGENVTLEQEGCCPHYEVTCQPEICQLPPICAPGFVESVYEGKCCLQYTCIPKKNVCVYEFKFAVEDGYQVALEPQDYHKEEFEAGSSWYDGLCQNCSCKEKNGFFRSECRIELCLNPDEFPDNDNYERESYHNPGECCPKYKRTACKMNDIIYKIGEKWPSPDGDRCKSFECVKHQDEATISRTTYNCNTTCPRTAVYVESTTESNKCCGTCIAVACEEDGVIYQNEESWTPATLNCHKATCYVNDTHTHIRYEGPKCPVMDPNCPMEYVRLDPKGCCKYCEQPTDTCSAVEVPDYETIGYFSYHDTERGFCTNEVDLEGLTRCSGKCSAQSLYSSAIGDFESICNCCLPDQTKPRTIALRCSDGNIVHKTYQQPLSCKCNSCSGRTSDRSHEFMNQMGSL